MKPDNNLCQKCSRLHEMVKGGYLYRVCLDSDVYNSEIKGRVIDKNFRIPNDCHYLLEQLVFDASENTFCPQCGEALNDELKCKEHGDIIGVAKEDGKV